MTPALEALDLSRVTKTYALFLNARAYRSEMPDDIRAAAMAAREIADELVGTFFFLRSLERAQEAA